MWWNLPFTLPVVTGILYVILLGLGVMPTGHDADADVDHDFSVDHDLSTDHSVEHHVGDGSHDHGMGTKVLTFLGIGRVPFSLLLLSFSFVWGFSGYVSNVFLEQFFVVPEVFIWPSFGIALALGILFTRYMAIGISRLIPSFESYGVSDEDMEGSMATVRYDITETGGTAQLFDKYGNLQEVPCRIRPGELPVPAGTKLFLMDFDRREKVFYVAVDPFNELEAPPARKELEEGNSHA